FGPRTVGILSADQIFDTALDTGSMGIIECQQAHDCPCGLRGGAWPLALENGVVVGVAAFAPAAIFVLNACEPIAGFEEPRLEHVDVQRAQTAQHLPRSVDVIDTPTAIPGAVFFLVIANEAQGLLDLRMLDAVAFVAQ